MKTTSITFRMDEDLKRDAEETLDEIGMNMSSAFTVFCKALVRSGKFPVELAIDPYYKKSYQEQLRRKIEDSVSGKTKDTQVTLTMEELEATADG